MKEYQYFVYILTNPTHTVLYIGVTNNLIRRMIEHKRKEIDGFTKKYNCTKLIYYEDTNDIHVTITREKQLKSWRHEWKTNLIKKINPKWHDLTWEILPKNDINNLSLDPETSSG